jgi:hypothetical protein
LSRESSRASLSSSSRFAPWPGDVQVLDKMPDSGFQRVGVVISRGALINGTDEMTVR